MRIFLNLCLVFVSVFACYFEDVFLFLTPPRADTTIPFTVRFRQPFTFDQEKAFGNKRQSAISEYIPLFDYIPDGAEKTAEELKRVSEKIASCREMKSSGANKLRDYLEAEYGVSISLETTKKMLKYKDLDKYIEGILSVEESLLQGKILENPDPLKDKNTVEVAHPKPPGVVAYPAEDVITLEMARARFQAKVEQLFWHVEKNIRDPILSIAVAAFAPNLRYDKEKNRKRIDEIVRRYPSTTVSYKAGQVLLPFGHVPSEYELLLLSDYKKEVGRRLHGKAAWVLIAILLTVLFYNLFIERILNDEWRKKPPYDLLISQLILTVFLLKLFLIFTPLTIYALPLGSLPLSIVLLNNDRLSATWTTLTAAVLVSLFAGHTVSILLFFVFSGMTAILVSLKIEKRIHVLTASLAIGAANSLLFLFLSIDWAALFSFFSGPWILGFGRVFNTHFLTDMGWVFMGGAASGPLAFALLPLLEMGWHTASAFKLNRYADLQHPLLKELLTKTPATYQHSMTVAYLAQSVGEAIGANTLLLRIGAYYHDIGKVANRTFFSENQSGAKNPHDDLAPQESARIIVDHVVNGEKIGREMKLPEVILDFITQHHGTQAVEFFYNKAVKSSQKHPIQRKDFQYRGPKPQSVETAILMICDAVEAASRSLEAPTRETLENMVRLLLIKRIADGQFDECHLSTGSLARIRDILVDSLEASFHSRVVYPWQEKQKRKIKDMDQEAA